jgi:hypothetical protein
VVPPMSCIPNGPPLVTSMTAVDGDRSPSSVEAQRLG